MKIPRIGILLIVALLATIAISFTQQNKDRDVLYQVSILDGLMQGDYDGSVTLDGIRKHGDFGIGTFDRLDGEAIELDGAFYRVKADGKVSRMEGSVKSPFAMATFFNADKKFSVDRKPDYPSLQGYMDNQLPTKNIPYAVKIDGKFDYVKVRSVPAQNKPYKIFSEVAKNQSVFEFRGVEGTLIGFRLPEYMKGVNISGYHMHFLSRDKTRGGHLLECSIVSGQASIDDISRFTMDLPQSQRFYNLDLSMNTDEALRAEKAK